MINVYKKYKLVDNGTGKMVKCFYTIQKAIKAMSDYKNVSLEIMK